MRRFPMVSIGVVRPTSDRADDFRQVPRSDTPEASYQNRGQLGGYAPSNEPYPPPDDVKFGSGFGFEESDARRGYIVPNMREQPAYDLDNYKDRSTLPRVDDPETDPGFSDEKEWEFRARGMRSRGFLTRSR